MHICTEALKSGSTRPRNPRSLPACVSQPRVLTALAGVLPTGAQPCFQPAFQSPELLMTVILRRILSAIGTSAPFSLLEASPSIQIFVDSICRQSASALELHVFSSAPHPLAFPLPASCDPSCFFCRSGRNRLLKMQVGFAFRVAYPLQLPRSQPWQCLYDLIFTFTPEIDAGEQRFLRDPHSNTE
jgi:hypothetical protein